ncbi:helix-turn-helix domain-containing protein [Streptomyces albidoflavus]
MLEGIGLDAGQERIYLALLAAPARDAAELAARTGLPEERVAAALGALLASGLAEEGPAGPGAVRAAPPEVSLGLRVLERMDELRRTRLAVERLAREFGDGAGAGESVEVVEGARQVAERYARLQREAREEILCLTGGPAVAVPAEANAGQRNALDAGVRYRVVYERARLEPGSSDSPLLLEEWAALGEEMRVTVEVPFKLVLSDRRRGLLLPREQHTPVPRAVLLREGLVLEAMVWLFHKVWESALPVPAALQVVADGPLSSDDQHLLSLLLAGYTDRAVASQLGLSMRTVQRRVHRLLALAGVQTRLQLGWRAAQLHWL